MFKRQAPLCVLLLTPLLATIGCSEDESETPYVGTYEVVSHTENTAGCDAEGDPVQGDTPFFSLEADNFFGVNVLLWHDCESADSCSEDSAFDRSFTREAGQWIAQGIFASGGVQCSLEITEGTISETESGIRIEFQTHSGVLTVASDDACDTEVAEERRSELECTGIEVFEAAQL